MTLARGRLSGRRLSRQLESLYRGCNKRWAVRGSVEVGTGLRLGSGSTVWSAHGLRIGNDAAIGRRCTVEVDGTIGDFFMTGAQVLIVGRADHALDTVGTPMLHSTWVGDRGPIAADRVQIGDDVWIGAGATVLGGVSIGSGAVIGAGSVVTKSLPAFAIAVGIPARQIGVRFPEALQREHLRGVATRSDLIRDSSPDDAGRPTACVPG